LRFCEMPPAPEQQLGAAQADGKYWATAGEPLRRARLVASIHTRGQASPQARGGSNAAADRMVGGLRLALLRDAAGY
jgi:hypothetical protein